MSQAPFTRRQALMATGGLAVAAATLGTEADAAIQPFMQAALDQLRQARATLARATPDKGGHRVKALADIDAAIAQVRLGMAFDNHH